MLKQRIIAKLLIENGTLVKYRRFTNDRRVVGDPIATVKSLEDLMVDEYLFTFTGKYDIELLRRMCDVAFAPVGVAGSVRSIDDVADVIRGGAEKVVVKNRALSDEIAMKFGSNAVAWAVDYSGDAPVFDVPTSAGEVVLTSIDRDGMNTGYDLGAVRHGYRVPVLLAGGCGKLAHVKAAFDAGADGAVISSMFAFTDRSPWKLRSWLASEGANVRPA